MIGEVQTVRFPRDVVHVVVDNVSSPTCDEPVRIGHMPFADEAIRSSVIELVEEGVRIHDDFKGGVAHWRQANGGVFTIAVSEAVDAVIGTVGSAGAERDPFDELVAEMRNRVNPHMIERVYDKLFALRDWVFIEDSAGVGGVATWVFPDGPNKTPAVLGFTSRAKAAETARRLGLCDEAGSVSLVSRTVEEVLTLIDQPSFGAEWFCFNLAHEEFPLYAHQARGRYTSRMRTSAEARRQ